jgi:hypothetical protein
MAISWGDMRAKVLRVLDDTDRSNPNWSDDDLIDYANEGLQRLAKHTALERVFSTVFTQVTSSVALPDDILEPGAVILTINLIPSLLTPVQLKPGQNLPTFVNPGGRTGYYWYPHGTLNFIRPVVDGRKLDVHYWAYYPPIPADGSLTHLLPIKPWMEEPLKWRMLVAALAKPGAQKAILAQYMTKRDSGNPEQNSLVYLARFYERQYDTVMGEHAAQDRGGWEYEND